MNTIKLTARDNWIEVAVYVRDRTTATEAADVLQDYGLGVKFEETSGPVQVKIVSGVTLAVARITRAMGLRS